MIPQLKLTKLCWFSSLSSAITKFSAKILDTSRSQSTLVLKNKEEDFYDDKNQDKLDLAEVFSKYKWRIK